MRLERLDVVLFTSPTATRKGSGSPGPRVGSPESKLQIAGSSTSAAGQWNDEMRRQAGLLLPTLPTCTADTGSAASPARTTSLPVWSWSDPNHASELHRSNMQPLRPCRDPGLGSRTDVTVRHGAARLRDGRTGDGAGSKTRRCLPGTRCSFPRSPWCSCPPAHLPSNAVLGRTRVLPGERVILAQNFLKIVDVCSVDGKEY